MTRSRHGIAATLGVLAASWAGAAAAETAYSAEGGTDSFLKLLIERLESADIGLREDRALALVLALSRLGSDDVIDSMAERWTRPEPSASDTQRFRLLSCEILERIRSDRCVEFLTTRIVDDAEDDFPRLLTGAGPMNFGAASLEFVREFDEVFVQVVDGFPFDVRGGLACGLPILEGGFGFITNDLVFAQGGLDEVAMAQITGNVTSVVFELAGESGHDRARTSAR